MKIKRSCSMAGEYSPQLNTTSQTLDICREDTSELSLEGWPGCPQGETALWGGIPAGICNSCKGEKMLDAITKESCQALTELWVCTNSEFVSWGGGMWLKSSLWRVLEGSVRSSYREASMTVTVIRTFIWLPISLHHQLHLNLLYVLQSCNER